jgi:hypothetical protein
MSCTFNRPDTILGYRKDGRAIYPIAGGSTPAVEPVIPPAVATPPGATITIPVTPEPVTPPQLTFTVADIERARKEEKDKLYADQKAMKDNFKTLQDELAKLTGDRDKKIAEETAAAEKAAADAKVKFESETDAKQLLELAKQEFAEKISKLEQERETDKIVSAKEREFNELQSYIQGRVIQVTGDNSIAPQLMDLINGNSVAEVEAMITTLQAKSQDIVDSINQATTVARSQQRGVSPTGYATTGPMDNVPGTRTLTAEDIRTMPMSEYAKIRGNLGVGASSQGNNQGMFG